jgi:hypothetical protein
MDLVAGVARKRTSRLPRPFMEEVPIAPGAYSHAVCLHERRRRGCQGLLPLQRRSLVKNGSGARTRFRSKQRSLTTAIVRNRTFEGRGWIDNIRSWSRVVMHRAAAFAATALASHRVRERGIWRMRAVLLKGVKLGDRTYRNHLDGYNQMDLLTGKGPSKRHEVLYFGGPQLGAIRVDDFKFIFFVQPYGWAGEKVTTDMPTPINLRQDPFERTPILRGESWNNGAPGYMNEFFGREMWRFVIVQQYVTQLALTAIDYPPMQEPASFNLDAVKKKIQEMIRHNEGQ